MTKLREFLGGRSMAEFYDSGWGPTALDMFAADLSEYAAGETTYSILVAAQVWLLDMRRTIQVLMLESLAWTRHLSCWRPLDLIRITPII